MPKNTTRLTILIDQPTKQKLEKVSESVDLTISQILRKLIKNHLSTYDHPIGIVSDEPEVEDTPRQN